MRPLVHALALLLVLATQAAAQSTGSIGASNSTHLVDVSGAAQASFTIGGTFDGTITFKTLHEGGTPVTVDCFTQAAPTTAVNSTTAAGSWSCPVAGFTFLELQFSSYVSGTATIVAATSNSGGTVVGGAGGGGGSNTAASATGGAVPSDASYTGVNIGGNLVGQTGVSVGSARAGAVAIVDGSGNQITSFGGGTQYTHDAGITPASSVGTMALGRSSAAAPTDVTADNEAVLPWYLRSGAQAMQVTFGGVLATTGNGVSGTGVQRVTIASDSTGVLGATQSGTWTVQPGNTANTTAWLFTGGLANDGAAAATNRLGTLPAVVQNSAPTLTDGRNAALSLTTGGAARVIVTNAAGAAQTLASDVVEDAAETAGGSGPMVMTVRRDTAASSAGTSGDNATANTDALGRMWVRAGNPCEDHARITTAAISNSTSGNVEVVALNGSDLIFICGYSLVAGAATGVRFVYGTGTACATGETGLTGAWAFAANGGITQANAGAPQFVVPAGNAFCTENTGANAIAGHVTYVRTAAP